MLPALPNFKKKVALALLKTILSTKPTLSTPKLQDPKSTTYVHFHLVYKQLIGLSFSK